MKSFLEEYGFAILAAIVVILLIAMCTPVGNLIRNQVMSVVESFAGRTESKLANIDANEVKIAVKADKDNKQIKVLLLDSPSTTDKYNVFYKVADGAWKDASLSLKLGTTEEVALTGATMGALNGQEIRIRLVDEGSGNDVAEGYVQYVE